MGNTRSGWIGSSVRLEKKFVEQIKEGNNQIGVAEAFSKVSFAYNKYSRWCSLTHSLIGCPEFEMWTDIPSVYDDISVARSNSSITVAGNGLNGSKVAITSGINGLPEIKTVTGASVTFNEVSPNSVVTVYKHNAIHCPAIPAKRHATFFTIFTREQRPHRPSGRYEPDGGRRCFKIGNSHVGIRWRCMDRRRGNHRERCDIDNRV